MLRWAFVLLAACASPRVVPPGAPAIFAIAALRGIRTLFAVQ